MNRRFCVVFKAEGSLAVGEDVGMFVSTDLIGPWGPIEFRLRTEFHAQAGGARLPADLTIEAETSGPSLQAAIEACAVVVHDLLSGA